MTTQGDTAWFSMRQFSLSSSTVDSCISSRAREIGPSHLMREHYERVLAAVGRENLLAQEESKEIDDDNGHHNIGIENSDDDNDDDDDDDMLVEEGKYNEDDNDARSNIVARRHQRARRMPSRSRSDGTYNDNGSSNSDSVAMKKVRKCKRNSI